MKLLQTVVWDCIDVMTMRLFGHQYARYGFPTVELIAWLKEIIGDRKAIEIGAGSGDLCYHLGILGTDNYQQTWPDVQLHYAATGQPTIKYGPWVERLEALDAVRRHKPNVVIGSWITHWIDPDKPMPPGGGNMYGLKEDELLELVDTYIMIGNLRVHQHKPILKLPHQELTLPFVKSRATYPDLDRVFIWSKT